MEDSTDLLCFKLHSWVYRLKALGCASEADAAFAKAKELGYTG